MADEFSPGGSKIYRHTSENFSISDDLCESSIANIDAHITKWLVKPCGVFHELVSPTVHVDVHIVPPGPDRDFIALVTSGLSDKPMNGPFPELRFAELVFLLPADWKLDEVDFEQEENYWPIRQLKFLARFPHEYNTWIWETHTIPNGDPAEAYASNTNLCGIALTNPISLPHEFRTLEVDAEKTIHFFSLIPLYKDEMDYKLNNGIEGLYDKFGKAGVSDVLDITRPSCITRSWLSKLLG